MQITINPITKHNMKVSFKYLKSNSFLQTVILMNQKCIKIFAGERLLNPGQG